MIVKMYRHVMEQPMGAYSTFDKALSYSYKLDKFPKLKKIVIEHELGHAKDKNLLQSLIRDLKDYFWIYQTNEYWDYMIYCNRNHNWWQLLIISWQNMIYRIINPLIYIVMMWIGMSSYLWRKYVQRGN